MPIVTDNYMLSLTQDNRILRVRCSQNDTSRQVKFTLYNNGTPFTIPSGLSVSVHGIKQNGNIFTKSCSYSGSVVTLVLGTQITDIAGISVAELVFTDSSGGKIGTSNFIFQVESDPLLKGTVSITEETPTEYISDLISMVEALSARVNNIISPAGEASLSEVVDARLSGYSGTIYQNLKARIDADFAALDNTKADKSDTYTKEEVDDAIDNVTITTDETLSVPGAAADAKKTGDAISEINGSLEKQANTIDRVEMDDIESLVYNGLTVTKCTVANGTVSNPSNTDAVNTSNYIPCAVGDTVTIYPVRTLPEGHKYKYAYKTYNENEQTINSVSTPSESYKTITIKNNSVKFIRFAIFEADETDTLVPLRANTFLNAPVAITRSGNAITDLMEHVSDVIHETDISNTVSWSIGGIGSDGTNWSRPYAIRSTYIPVVKTISLDADYVAWCSFYDENHRFIKRVQNLKGDSAVKNVYSGEYTYLRLEVKYAPNDTDDTTPITDTSRSEHVRLYKTVVDVDVDAESVWKKYDHKHYEDLISQSKYAYASNSRVLTLLHFSDIHGDFMGMKFALNVYDSLSYKIDDIIHTGDTVTYNYSNGINNWIQSGCADRVLNVIGNHDTEENSVLQAAGKDNVYNTFFAPYISNWDVVQPANVDTSGSADYHALYYYKDYDTPKIRLIVLDTNFWDSAQSAWLTETLESAKEDGYAIILACHNVKKLTEMTDSNFSSYKGDGITENTNTYANQPDNWLDPVADFMDAGGEFICMLAGHNHDGHMGYLTLYPNIFCYVSDKASVARTSGAARRSGENNANTVNIVTVNVTEKLFKIVKIGAEVDGKMRGRHVFCYDYANKRIISQW